MSGASLTLVAAREADGTVRLKAPRLGVWSAHPGDGDLAGPGAFAGYLAVAGTRYRLVVPDGVAGRVVSGGGRDHAVPVAYGDDLLVLAPIGETSSPGEAPGPSAATAASGTFRVVAPTAGVFYASPSPGAPPFLSPGARVRSGQAIGLLEVMKTFNPIPYEGAGLPDEAVVVEVLAADGQEVRAGQPLYVVK